MNNFKAGEEYAIKCLQHSGYNVIDRRQQPEYWAMDIDFTAIKDGRTIEIEVKWDSRIHKSGALFFELLADIQKGALGWSMYSCADYIFYGSAAQKVFYVFEAAEMRRYLERHKGEYETRKATDYDIRTGAIKKQSLGAIIPLAAFCKEVPVQVIEIEKRLAAIG